MTCTSCRNTLFAVREMQILMIQKFPFKRVNILLFQNWHTMDSSSSLHDPFSQILYNNWLLLIWRMDFSASTSSDDFPNLHPPPPPGPVELKVKIIFVLVALCIKLKVLLDGCGYGCVIWYMMITSDNFACQLSLHNHHHQTYCQARLCSNL